MFNLKIILVFQSLTVFCRCNLATRGIDDGTMARSVVGGDMIISDRDAQHRGPAWYSDGKSSEETESEVNFSAERRDVWTSNSSEGSAKSQSSDASSQETKESVMERRLYRQCNICPDDMMKAHNNKGIKWICGGYQRARRTFKSECMMRYRNCEDGTMFVKMHDFKCKHNSYHGKHWFYEYKTE